MNDSTALDLKGRRALITGGSRGLGAVLARTLAAHGAHVFINYVRQQADAEATLQAIRDAGGSGELAQANLSRPEEIRSMFEGPISEGLDILVHNAAIGSFKPAHQVRANQWDLSMNVNARALLLCVQEAIPLLSQREGRVVAVSSLGSHLVIPNYGAIGTSKAALEALTRYLGVELAPRGIHVNAVSGGLLDLPSVRHHAEFDALAAATIARTPAQRLGTAEDIARIVLFLCSPLSNWMVGQTIVADGGMSLTV
jgi:NAD(P)-dependent dehydrogenase (short-subunit alcohol dehydrogenase family)